MNNTSKQSWIPVLFLVIYLLFIFYITLYTRSFSLERFSKLEPFWSYVKWFEGDVDFGEEILLNIALFIPLGYYLVSVLKSWNIKKAGIISTGISLFVSVAIETVQYMDGLGLCEFDDVFNNVMGACIGVGIYSFISHFVSADRLPTWRMVISVLFLMAGVAGCNMVIRISPLSPCQTFAQFNFAVDQVRSEGKTILLKGRCYAYNRDTPKYQIVLQGEKTGKQCSGDTEIEGSTFCTAIPAGTEEKFHVMVKFKVYKPISTFTYINKDRVEYVKETVPEPDICSTDLGIIVSQGILKAYNPTFDMYVYQFNNTLYWLIGTPIDKRGEIICHLYTNETDKLPVNRRKYKFDNLGFRAGAKNEGTQVMRCGKYSVFERVLPSNYNITFAYVGFYVDKKMQWESRFRVL